MCGLEMRMMMAVMKMKTSSTPLLLSHTPSLPGHCLRSDPDRGRWPERSSSPTPDSRPWRTQDQSLRARKMRWEEEEDWICFKTWVFSFHLPWSTWLFLPRFGQVGDAGVRTQQHVAGVQRPLQEQLLCLRQVDATQGSLGQSVGGHQGQAVHPHLVDPVDRLQRQLNINNNQTDSWVYVNVKMCAFILKLQAFLILDCEAS